MIIDLRDTFIRLFDVPDRHTEGIRVRFDFPQENPLESASLRFLTYMGEEGVVEGPELPSDATNMMDVNLPISSREGYFKDRNVFEGYGRVLGQDQPFAIEVQFNGTITIHKDGSLLFLMETAGQEMVDSRLPLPGRTPRTVWARLADLDPAALVADLTPGWGDDLV